MKVADHCINALQQNTLPGRRTVGCPLLQVCALGWVKCREHISLLIILCIIVYVTNKAHLSLICILYCILQHCILMKFNF